MEDLDKIAQSLDLGLDKMKKEGSGKSRIVIVTGMSGGGKTQACRYMEDLGYFCVDNLPPVFIPKFAELCAHVGGHVSKVVLVVDTRSREFFDTFLHVLEDMDKSDQPYEMLFMDASDAMIIRRYKETRRRHPMAPSSRISEGVAKERERLASVRSKATYIIDTSELKKAELKDKIIQIFGSSEGEQMNINVLSFGFKFGMPLDADMVLDVRFLPNPFYVHAPQERRGAGGCGLYRRKAGDAGIQEGLGSYDRFFGAPVYQRGKEPAGDCRGLHGRHASERLYREAYF